MPNRGATRTPSEVQACFSLSFKILEQYKSFHFGMCFSPGPITYADMILYILMDRDMTAGSQL